MSYTDLGHGSSMLTMAWHSAGAVVFGIFLFLPATAPGRGCAAAASPSPRRAGLRLEPPRAGAHRLAAQSWFASAIEMLSFSSLNLLAPVLLDLSLNHRCPLATAGYATCAAAVVPHVAEVAPYPW